MVGLGVGEVGDGVSLDEGRRHGTSRSPSRRVGQQVARVVDAAQVATTPLLLLLLLLLLTDERMLRRTS